jgi:hypothetical protein
VFSGTVSKSQQARSSVRRTRLKILYCIRDARTRNPRKHGEACAAVVGREEGLRRLVRVMAISNAPRGYGLAFVWRVVYSRKTRAERGLDAFVNLI